MDREPMNVLAIVALVFGLLSPLAIFSRYFWIVPGLLRTLFRRPFSGFSEDFGAIFADFRVERLGEHFVGVPASVCFITFEIEMLMKPKL